jgi:2-oxo-3-hexenedioate decarboxylase/2-keto-4-pentenoate hydratase
MDRDAIEQAAGLLARARLEHVPLEALPEACRPRNEAEAYAIQARLQALEVAAGLGTRIGWKIGCTTPVMQSYMGIDHPCAGGVFDSRVAESSPGEPAGFEFDDFCRIGVECEIVVRLGVALPADRAPYSRESVAAAVTECMAGIEVIDDHFQDFRKIDVWTLAADEFMNGGCVLGPPVAGIDPMALDALAGRMTVNGAAAGEGRGRDILGHPLEALAWLANLKAREGANGRADLAAGEIVMLGSVVETRWLARGDSVEVDIEGLGTARALFE